MSKKIKVLVSILVAVLLIAAVPATIALAQEEDDASTQANAPGLIARVAEILGVSQGDMVAAFEQARQELREECQATENCSVYQQGVGDGLMKRWQARNERGEESEGARGRWGQRSESMEHPGFNIRPTMRGRQMIDVAEGWNEPMPEGPIY